MVGSLGGLLPMQFSIHVDVNFDGGMVCFRGFVSACCLDAGMLHDITSYGRMGSGSNPNGDWYAFATGKVNI